MISQEARELLAAVYIRDKMPWFAEVIMDPRYKQFNRPLEVITRIGTANRTN